MQPPLEPPPCAHPRLRGKEKRHGGPERRSYDEPGQEATPLVPPHPGTGIVLVIQLVLDLAVILEFVEIVVPVSSHVSPLPFA